MNELELLQLAGKMATAARKVTLSDAKSLSNNIVKLEEALNEYDKAILNILNKK